jgi:hypothetical protein
VSHEGVQTGNPSSEQSYGYVAGFVLVFSPFTNTGLALMAVSGVVALICFAAYMWSEPEEDYPQNSN